jgi:V8-like Glu-specific endopeptidase
MKRHNPAEYPPPIDPLTLSREELAKMLRPVRLVGEFAYQLGEPDFLVADSILAMKEVPNTEGSPGNASAFARFIIGSDDRRRVENPRFCPGASNARLSQNCSATMIGPSTAHSAAHCFHTGGSGGSWITSNSIAFGADTVPPGPAAPFGSALADSVTIPAAPFGSALADSVTIPTAWITGSINWDWDFAVLEYSPSRPDFGRQTGWHGTGEKFNGAKTMIGYPTDKPIPSPWIKGGTFTTVKGGRYEHNLDIIPGDSGAAAYDNGDDRSNGIQSTQWRIGNPRRTWNEVRKWDATTHNFFDAYGNWPRA